MSHWTTSGRDRLRAAQKSSFAQRAQMRANVVAPESMMLPGHHPPRQTAASHAPSMARRNLGTKRKYSYGNPIARRGKAVQIGASRSTIQHAAPPQPIQHPSYAHESRRIRDPTAARYLSPRMVPHGQQSMHSHPGHVGARSAPPFQESPQQMAVYQESPNQQARLYRSVERTAAVAPPLSRSHPYAPHEQFSQHYDTLQGEGGWGDSSVRTNQHQQLFQSKRPSEMPPPGFQRFRKPAMVADLFDPMELPWEGMHLGQELDDTWSIAGNSSFGPSTALDSARRTQAGPFAESQCHGPLSGQYDETPADRDVHPMSAPEHPPVSFVARQIGLQPQLHENPSTSMNNQQRSTEENEWDILPEVPSTSRNRPLATYKSMEAFPVDQDGSMSVDWENLGDRNNFGLSRFQQTVQDHSVVAEQPTRYLQPHSRPNISETATRSRDVPSHTQHPRQTDHDLGMSPPLRFFNEGVEIDIHGRPLSRPGSPRRPDPKISADSNSMGVKDFPHDDSWNPFF